MKQSDFGKILRDKRKKYHKTQEEIATSIKKNKMLISGMESGKNNPPIGKDLIKMMKELGLDEEEKREFETIAAMERNTLPDKLINLIKKDKRVIEILYEISDKKLTDEKYKEIVKILK